MPFEVRFRNRRIERELRSIGKDGALRVAEAISGLAHDPYPAGSLRLRGNSDMRRSRAGDC